MQTKRANFIRFVQFPVDSAVWVSYGSVVFVCLVVMPATLLDYGYSFAKLTLAGTLLSICIFPSAYYWARREAGVPTLAIICLAYALQFALPIYVREPAIILAGGMVTYVQEDDVIACLTLSIIGVTALIAGYYACYQRKIINALPTAHLPIDPKKALTFGLVMGILLPVVVRVGSSVILDVQSVTQFSAIIRVLLNQTIVSIAVLTGIVYSELVEAKHRLLLLLIVLFATVQGISSGMLEDAVLPLAVFMVMRWSVTKKIPIVIITIAISIILFLSPVKKDYRQAVWFNRTDETIGDSAYEKTKFWVDSAIDHWADVFNGLQSFSESTEVTASRLDLIHQFSHIYSLTPSVVQYQNGATYSYFLVSLIPRFLWPGKPEAGSANYFYAVSYGITDEEGARRSSFGMSLLAEGFINFGWLGIIIVMALQGMVLCALQLVFGRNESKLGGQAIFVSFFVYFLNGIGSSAEIIFGNLLQSLIFSTMLVWWARSNSADKFLMPSLGTPNISNGSNKYASSRLG